MRITVSTESTQSTSTFAALGPAIEALVYLQATFPHMPDAYTVVQSGGWKVDLQVHAPHEFEAWRTALQMSPADVDLVVYGGSNWLRANTTVCGVRVELSSHDLPLPKDPCRPCGCPLRFDRHADGCPAQTTAVTTLAQAHGGAR
jgi:hypothetical protein